MSERFFITSSGTGIGKTLITATLAHQLHSAGNEVHALKPVISGYQPNDPASDTAQLLQSMKMGMQYAESISPWRFKEGISPNVAAEREGRHLHLKELVGFCARPRGGITLIEGAGGVMAPIDDRHVMRDWIAALEIPAVLVCGSYLGTISHTLTALVALREVGVSVTAAIVAASPSSPVSSEETAEVIARHGGVATRVLPRLAIGADGLAELAGTPDISDLIA